MKLILAADRNWGIGKNNGLLCHLPGDLQYFKEKTLGSTVVMGRKTLESLPGGKPLPKRNNIILTRSELEREDCMVIHSLDALWKLLKEQNIPEKEVFVIGGAEIYRQLLPYCDTCYITKMDAVFDADRFFEDLDASPEFTLYSESEPREENGISYRFCEYRRVN